IDPATWKATSDESTSWYEPSNSSTCISTIGYPPRIPLFAASLTPSSTGLMYSFGIAPPTILDSNVIPDPSSPGAILIQQSPYCPEPPDCLTNLPCASAGAVMDSL